MKGLHMVTFTLLAVGGLNWGLVGLFNYNLVESLLGSYGGVVQLVYVLVGAAAVVEVVTHPKNCKLCAMK